MPSRSHMTTPADDQRHVPGPGALPLWNESFWFPLYDPKSEIGVVFRVGTLWNQQTANLYLFITHKGVVVHSLIDHALPFPAMAADRLSLACGLDLEWTANERFRLRYRHPVHGFDLDWRGMSPTYLYPFPPDAPVEQYPRHIEHAAVATGTVTINGTAHRFDGLAHRDHSWGGERDWAKMWHWEYLSGEIGRDLWFHAVRIKLTPEMEFIHIGCLWDGTEVQALSDIAFESRMADGGTRQLAIVLDATDERGRRWRFVGEEALVSCNVQFGRTWLKDAFMRFRSGDRVGYGIFELGYVERASMA